jgi:putative lipase involved disintegration of autophagic bodies
MNKTEIKTIIKPENGIEEAIISDIAFIEGANWGKVRSGHPEAQVIYHIQEVLANIDKFYGDDADRGDLRVIAIVHDTFKYKVNQNLPKSGENHHGTIARRFAEKFPIHVDVLTVIELHDDAYNAWSQGDRHGDWYKANKRATNLINALQIENCLELYVKFYKCDNATGDKSIRNFNWFNNLIK